jgi:hypothetical protein
MKSIGGSPAGCHVGAGEERSGEGGVRVRRRMSR